MALKFRVIILPLLAVIIFTGNSYCQNFAPSREAYQAEINAELSKSPDAPYLNDHADAYSRLLHLRVLRNLGYDVRKMKHALPSILASRDSGMLQDVSNNEADQNETSIGINRKNPNLIIAGANDMRMYFSGMSVFTSEDQGKNWGTHYIEVPSDSLFPVPLGDPAVAAGDNGNFYYAYLAGDDSYERDNIIVAVSSDGKNWKNGNYIIPAGNMGGFEDKEQIAVDNNPSSPYYGRVYIVWMHFESPISSLLGGARLAWSDDGCMTWSKIVTLTDQGISEFSQIKTGVNGEVIITFSTPDFKIAGGNHMMLVSKDGSKNFTKTVLATYTDYPTNDYNRDGLKGSFGFRCFPYIAEDIDQRNNYIHLVYATWEHVDNKEGAASVLYYISSSDLGSSWSAPKPVGIANPDHCTLAVDRFCPWVSVNQQTGDAYALYYSSENDTNNLLITAYYAKLSDGLTSYPRQIGDRDFDGTLVSSEMGEPPFIGDYIGSDISASLYAAAWTENRKDHSDGDIYAYVSTNFDTGSPVVINSSNIWLGAPSPNPSSGKVSFSYYLPQKTPITLALYSVTGVRIKILSQEESESGTYMKDYDISGIASGDYFIRLSTEYGSTEKKLIIIK